MLRRLGNKSRLLPKLLPLFPENITTFIDMFMGSGAVTFAMVDRAHSIIANDKDAEVFNLFMMLKNRKEELIEIIETMPVHETLFQHWKTFQEYDQVWRATRFLMLSNFGYLGKPDILAFYYDGTNPKINLLQNINNSFKQMQTVSFMCCDFHEVLSKIPDHKHRPLSKKNSFIYADPPYIGTGDNYQESFTENDTRDLFSILTSSGIRFALSEFRHPLVIALAEEHGLHITSLGERRNLKNRREEILITNYQPERRQGSLFSEGTAARSANKGLHVSANGRAT